MGIIPLPASGEIAVDANILINDPGFRRVPSLQVILLSDIFAAR